MLSKRREHIIFALIALVGAFIITRWTVAQPTYTDSFYYLNAANRLGSGEGLTDAYLWNYVNAPDSLPAASHRYWMPLASLSAVLGMWMFNAPHNYAAAQLPFTLMYAALIYVGFWIGAHIGRTRRHAWIAGLITLFSGFFIRFWGETSTFAPYGLAGALCLVFLGLSVTSPKRPLLMFFVAGVCAGFGHLARADGILLLLVGYITILWQWWAQRKDENPPPFTRLGLKLIALTIGYLVVMTPWFIRNLNEIGSPLPSGALQGIWFREYDDIFSYPFNASPQTFFGDGIGILFESRWLAFTTNVTRFIAEQGMVIMTPLMLIGLWNRRRESFFRAFWLYALALFIAMTFVFPYPGYRGGLFHSAAALVPFWAVLGIVGLDDVVDWIARRRRHWNARTAKTIFSVGLLTMAILLSLSIIKPAAATTPPMYTDLMQRLPADARVMINDPAALYYFTDFGGVVLPNQTPDVIPQIAQRYGINYLVLEFVTLSSGDKILAAPHALWFDPDSPPDFLTEVPINTPDVRLYEIHR
jgi:hypothetical protein